MFTGIVEERGRVESVTRGKKAIRLVVRSRVCARRVKVGDSMAVNGCCLTVAKWSARGSDRLLHFDLLEETWARTNLPDAPVGAAVNLEPALRMGDPLGGHFVTGHVDGVGKIVRWEQVGRDHVLEISAPARIMRGVVVKGSIAVDGISLTVAVATRKYFRVWIIPHTVAVTALRERRKGDAVNLETDLLGKYVVNARNP